MEFIISKAPFMKNNINKNKILLVNLLMLIPFLIYRFLIDGLNSIIIFLIIFTTTFIAGFIGKYINYKKKENNYYKELIHSIITMFIIPINTPYLLLFFVNMIVLLILNFYEQINKYLVIPTIIFFVMLLTNNSLHFVSYNIYTFLILLIIGIITLISTRAIKFRITLIVVVFIIIKLLIFKNIESTDYLLLFFSVFVISEFKSTPNPALIQIIFGILIGLLSLFLNIEILFISIIILNIIFNYISQSYSYYLAK